MTEILPGLFVGTREDAEALGEVVPDDWTCISVTEYRAHHGRKEELPREPRGALDLPFMRTGKADSAMLDQVADAIWDSLVDGKKVLVHCVHAHERSPLAIAWFLVWSGVAAHVEHAYVQIQSLHPSVERRHKWLQDQPKMRHGLVQVLLARSAREGRSCPCVHTTPCHPRCTCVSSVSSVGCRRCCSYGSAEQRVAMAKRIASAVDRVTETVE